MEFNYYLPVNLVFGIGKIEQTGELARKYGRKALIVTGRGSTKRSGLLERVGQRLKAADVNFEVFDEVEPNPVSTTADKAVRQAKNAGCDIIIGLGGGSIMDCAKIVAFLLRNEGDIFDYIFGVKTGTERAPLILIPTTCGTGSEGNGFAVMTNPETKDKKSLRTSAIVADVSIVDPEAMTTMPAPVLASVGFDALCHCMEAYLSRITQPLVEMMALSGMKLIHESLIPLVEDPSDRNRWEKLTLASTLGGMCIHTAQVTLPHGMEHPASGLKNIIHGHGLAALTPVIYEKSIDSAPEKFAAISKSLGGKGAGDCVEVLNCLLERIGLKTTLGKEGIEEKDIDWMTDNCMKISQAGIQNHPKLFTKEEIRQLYFAAL